MLCQPEEFRLQAGKLPSKWFERILASGPKESEVKEPSKHVPSSEELTKKRRLAIRSTKARYIALSAIGASVRKTDARTRMSRVGGIAAEHPDSRTEFRTTQRDHMLTRLCVSFAAVTQELRAVGYRIWEATMSRWLGLACVRMYWMR